MYKTARKEQKEKKSKTNSEQIHMFTYWTYLHIGNNNDNYLFKIFSFFFGKVVYPTQFQITELQKN